MHTFCLQQFKTYEDAYFFNCINLKDTDINILLLTYMSSGVLSSGFLKSKYQSSHHL